MSGGGAVTNSFRDLCVWREAIALVEEVYALSKDFPAGRAIWPDRPNTTSSHLGSFEHCRKCSTEAGPSPT
jgi:hypothetical protein